MAASLHACAPFDAARWDLGVSRNGTRSRTTLATDSASGARVALKTLRSGPINPDSADHLMRELDVARFLDALEDPRVAHLALPRYVCLVQAEASCSPANRSLHLYFALPGASLRFASHHHPPTMQ